MRHAKATVSSGPSGLRQYWIVLGWYWQIKLSITTSCYNHLLSIWEACWELSSGRYVKDILLYVFPDVNQCRVQYWKFEYLSLTLAKFRSLSIRISCLCKQIDIFTEEIIRSGTAASLSQLLNRIDPILRAAANLGRYVSQRGLLAQLTSFCMIEHF